MSKERRAIFTSIASYAAAGGVKGLCLWCLFLLVARNSSTELAGQFGIALAILSPVFALLNLNLRLVLATDQKSDYHFFDYQNLRTISSITAAIISVGVGFLLGFDNGTVLALLISLVVARLFETNSDIRYGIMQKNHRLDLAAVSMFLGSILSVLSVALTLWATDDISIALLTYPIGYAIVYLLVDIPNGRKFLHLEKSRNNERAFSLRTLGSIAWLSAPLGIVAALLIYRANVPKYALDFFTSKTEVGVFTALYFFIPLLVLPLSAANQTLSPRLAKLFADGHLRLFVIRHSFLFFVALLTSIVGILFAYFFGEYALRLLYDERYVYPKELLIIMASQPIAFLAGAMGAGLSSMRKFSIQGRLGIVVALIVTLAAIPLVSKFGLVGACYLPAVEGGSRLLLQSVAYVIFLRRRAEEVRLAN